MTVYTIAWQQRRSICSSAIPSNRQAPILLVAALCVRICEREVMHMSFMETPARINLRSGPGLELAYRAAAGSIPVYPCASGSAVEYSWGQNGEFRYNLVFFFYSRFGADVSGTTC